MRKFKDFEQYCCYEDEEREKEIKYLDELDILPFLVQGIELEELINQLYEAFNDEYDGEDMFAKMDDLDVMYYICLRFNVAFKTISTITMCLDDDPQKGTRYDKDLVSDVSEVD